MNQELTTSFELVERRLALMRELTVSLDQAQSTVVRSDLAGINGYTMRQGEICEALRQLEFEALQHPPCTTVTSRSRNHKVGMQLPGDTISPLIQQRWKMLAQELNQVEMRANHLNQVYGALLRRARRTVQIFNRVLESSAITYAPPKPAIAESVFHEVSHV
jgi:flagellar biosynthesis/type III secretory pathway chaperone